MRRLNPDPDLDDLVRQLNQTSSPEEGSEETSATGDDQVSTPDRSPTAAPEQPALSPGREQVTRDEPLARWLLAGLRRDASDLLLVTGSPVAARVHGDLVFLDGEPLSEVSIREAVWRHLGPSHRRHLEERGASDLSLRFDAGDLLPGKGLARFRVNVHRQRGSLAVAIRTLPGRIPTLEELNLPPQLTKLVEPHRGLVLVCGPTGSGKSSTLAALLDVVNRNRQAHVITIEDPVEYEHRHRSCLVEHIEIGRDAVSFAAALRSALRQDPDVLLVGELRDLETITTALTAAETGHLILATLHTNDVVQTVHRLVDVFQGDQQGQIRQQLALCLHGILSQQLVPRASGSGRVPAVELLLANDAVRNHIRTGKLVNLYNEIVLGKRSGMVTLEESLARLVSAGIVDPAEATRRAGRPDELCSLLAREDSRLGGG